MSSDLAAQRAELETQLKVIKEQERKEAFATINLCLAKWRKHLEAKAVGIDEQMSKKYKLIIKPPLQARHSCLQSISYLNLTHRETQEWDYETYRFHVTTAEPLLFYADDLSDLMPPTGDDWVWITQYGIIFEIELQDDASTKEHAKTLETVQQLQDDIRKLQEKLQESKTVFSNRDQALEGVEVLRSIANQKRSFDALTHALMAGSQRSDFKTMDRKLKKLRKDVGNIV